MSGKILGSYIIGSVARGEHDQQSDLDILALVEDGAGTVPEAEVLRHVPREFRQLDVGVSWYGVKRVREMFRNGELFAWHIFSERIVLEENCFSFGDLGSPAPYTNALDDVSSFQRILSDIPDQLSRNPVNAIYEFGLIYVCLRNIAMSATGELNRVPDFSRYSPYNIEDFDPLPLSRQDYDLAMRCRMSGQRGLAPPREVDKRLVNECYLAVSPWIACLKESLRDEGNC